MSAIRNRLIGNHQGARVVAEADAKAHIAEQLIRLEDDLRRVKIEFDIYLNGGAKRPPYDTKNRIETTLKRLADDRSMQFAQRYLYNSLAGRFTAFQNLWRRSMQNREEGRSRHVPRHLQSLLAPPVAAPEAVAAPTENAPLSHYFTCSDAGAEAATVKAMYDSLVAAKRQCGENPDEVPFELFQKVVVNKTQSLRERHHCASVRFSVLVDGGKVNFKAQAENG